MLASSPFCVVLPDRRLRCTLCPRGCVLRPGKRGICGTRANRDGQLEVLTYGRFAAVAVDPIEKKPLSHFLPGTRTFSLGTEGCNLICPFCQNASLSQCPIENDYDATAVRSWTPEEVVQNAIHHKCDSIAFTYSEPVLSTEFAMDVAGLAADRGLKMIFVTNGQINDAPLEKLSRCLDAANVDLKSFSSATYKDVLKGDLSATLNAITRLHQKGIWVEVTTLVVPGINDTAEELAQIAAFIANVSRDIPWHISRFHPAYRYMNSRPTDVLTISNAMEIGAEAGLRYVYAGNVSSKRGENTCCPECKSVVVDRAGFFVNRIYTKQSKCPHCGWHIAGVGFP